MLAVLLATGAVVWFASSRGDQHPTAAADRTSGSGTGLGGNAPAGTSPSAASAAAAGGAQKHASPTPSVDPNLIGQDNFTGTAINTSRWTLYGSTAENGATWTPANDRVAKGELQIVGTWTNTTGGQGNSSGGLCWCGTDGDRTYGKWQLRAKFDAGSGFDPVIGLWPSSGNEKTDGWMTMAGVHPPARNTVSVSMNWSGGGQTAKLSGNFTTWHTYTVEWRPTFVKLWVDSHLVYDSTKTSGTKVIPNKPMHLYIQQQVGPSDSIAAPNASTPAQVVVHVDWVKVYR